MASIGTPRSNSLLADARAVGLEHAGRAARQDDGAGGVVVDHGLGLVERMDLAIDAGLAHPARDQLGHLAAEIDDQNALVMGFGGGHGRWLSSVVFGSVSLGGEGYWRVGPALDHGGEEAVGAGAMRGQAQIAFRRHMLFDASPR
jgi:hypothetical protein